METIGTLYQEGLQIQGKKPKPGNYIDFPNKQIIYTWAQRCMKFLKESDYIEERISQFAAASKKLGVKEMIGVLDTYCRHQEELANASPIIKFLGYHHVSFDMCDDRPDIVLPSRSKRDIGIEVTDYVHGTNIADYKKELMEKGYTYREETDVDYNLLYSRIENKEKKLNDYKADERNKTIRKYILVINVPSAEIINIDKCAFITWLKTQYDNIYIVDVERFIQIR